MAGLSDMAVAVGHDQIVKVLQEHVPSVEYELVYHDDEQRWHGIVRSADGLRGEGAGDTKAAALKLGYNMWQQTRLRALDSTDAVALATEVIQANSEALGADAEGADSSASEPASGGAAAQAESEPAAPPPVARPRNASRTNKGKTQGKRGK